MCVLDILQKSELISSHFIYRISINIFQLTEEERVKVDRRREQNRMAAQRFRQKQKTLGDRVQKVRTMYIINRL